MREVDRLGDQVDIAVVGINAFVLAPSLEPFGDTASALNSEINRLSSITRALCRKVVAARHQKDAPAACPTLILQPFIVSITLMMIRSVKQFTHLSRFGPHDPP